MLKDCVGIAMNKISAWAVGSSLEGGVAAISWDTAATPPLRRGFTSLERSILVKLVRFRTPQATFPAND